MANTVVAQVTFEIGQIEKLLAAYADLLTRGRSHSTDLVATTAVASVLHSFYSGLENIFLAIAKQLDQQTPTGGAWHRELLKQMTFTTERRRAVISAETEQQLSAYLSFRHFYRHSYSFVLDWSELEKLVIPLPDVWAGVKAELTVFLDNLQTDSATPGRH